MCTLELVLENPLIRKTIFDKLDMRKLQGIQSIACVAVSGALGSVHDTKTAVNEYWETLRTSFEPLPVSSHKVVTVALLKRVCKEAGVAVSGTKTELLQRLHPLSMPPRTRKRIRRQVMMARMFDVSRRIRKLRVLAKECGAHISGRLTMNTYTGSFTLT